MKTSEVQWPHVSRAVLIAGFAAAAIFVSACGSDADSDTTNDDSSSDSSDTTVSAQSGEVMSVLDASAQAEGAIVTVQGFLIEDNGTLYISDLIAESFPPQPGGAAMEVEGVVLEEFDGVAEEGKVRWRDVPATITATVKSGKLVDAQVPED